MSEGTPTTGRVGRVRGMVYARLEETSFRSGAAAGAAVLAVAGLAVTLAVTLGGHQVPPTRATAAGTAVPSARPSGAPLSSAARSQSASPWARRVAPAPWFSVAADDVPEAQVTPATNTRTPTSGWPPPGPWKGRHHRRPPGWPFPWRAPFPPPWWSHSAG